MAIITCKSCGMKIVLSPKYDDYEGKVECESCGSVSEVKINRGEPVSVKLEKEVILA